MRILPLIAAQLSALSLCLPAPVLAQDAPAAPRPLTDSRRADLRCAAAFALAASAQARGEAAAQGLPPLRSRGKLFFTRNAEQAMAETGMTREQVRDVLTADVAAIQKQATDGADNALAATVRPCLPRLDAQVPPLRTPDLLQCSAILALAYEEVHAREGMSTAAMDLKTLASVLGAREHEALVATGISSDEADATIARAHDAMLKEAMDSDGGVEKYDIDHCYDLAKPDAKSHY